MISYTVLRKDCEPTWTSSFSPVLGLYYSTQGDPRQRALSTFGTYLPYVEKHVLPLLMGTCSENFWTIFRLGLSIVTELLQSWYILQYDSELGVFIGLYYPFRMNV